VESSIETGEKTDTKISMETDTGSSMETGVNAGTKVAMETDIETCIENGANADGKTSTSAGTEKTEDIETESGTEAKSDRANECCPVPLSTRKNLDKRCVRFSDSVDVYEFKRTQAGSCGVPKKGGYSLGLGGKGTLICVDFELYEKERGPKRRKHPTLHPEQRLQKLCEVVRRNLLLKHMSEEDLNNHENQLLDEIRGSREDISCPQGCLCNDPEICPCVRENIQCHDDGGYFCGCSRRCKNPSGRYSYDLFRVTRYRQKVLKKGARGQLWWNGKKDGKRD